MESLLANVLIIDCGANKGDAVRPLADDIVRILGDDSELNLQYLALEPQFSCRNNSYIQNMRNDFVSAFKVQHRRLRNISVVVLPYLAAKKNGGRLFWWHFGSGSTISLFKAIRMSIKSLFLEQKFRHALSIFLVKWLPSLRLSDLIDAHASLYDHIFLKLDVEGAEYEILEDLISSGKIGMLNKLYIEFHDERVGVSPRRKTVLVSKIKLSGVEYEDWS